MPIASKFSSLPHSAALIAVFCAAACSAEYSPPRSSNTLGSGGNAGSQLPSGSGGEAPGVGGAIMGNGDTGGFPSTGGAAGETGSAGNGGTSSSGAGGRGGEAGGAGGEPPVGTGVEVFYGGEGEVAREKKYHFREEGGTVVIEAEHFVRQIYGDQDYEGKRWWMVQNQAFDAKANPGFGALCELGVQELKDMDTEVAGKTLRSIITNHKDILYWTAQDIVGITKEGSPLEKSGEQVVSEFGCDADPLHVDNETSGGAYIELLPDLLYNNHNAIPHAGCNWYSAAQAPRAYYKVTFSTAGSYKMCIRAFRTEADSGSAHGGFIKQIGVGEAGVSRLDVANADSGKWVWTQNTTNVEAGEGYIMLAGREDGFEVDKIVVTQGACPSGAGPAESPTIP